MNDRIYARIIHAERRHLDEAWLCGFSRVRSEDRVIQYERRIVDEHDRSLRKYALLLFTGHYTTVRQLTLFREKNRLLLHSFIHSLGAQLPLELTKFIAEHTATEFSRLKRPPKPITHFPSLDQRNGYTELELTIDGVGVVDTGDVQTMQILYAYPEITVEVRAQLPYNDHLNSTDASRRVTPLSVAFHKGMNKVHVRFQNESP